MLRIILASMNVKSSFLVNRFLIGIWTATLAIESDRNMLVHSDIDTFGKVSNFLPFVKACMQGKMLVLDNGILPLYSLYIRCRKSTYFKLSF